MEDTEMDCPEIWNGWDVSGRVMCRTLCNGWDVSSGFIVWDGWDVRGRFRSGTWWNGWDEHGRILCGTVWSGWMSAAGSSGLAPCRMLLHICGCCGCGRLGCEWRGCVCALPAYAAAYRDLSTDGAGPPGTNTFVTLGTVGHSKAHKLICGVSTAPCGSGRESWENVRVIHGTRQAVRHVLGGCRGIPSHKDLAARTAMGTFILDHNGAPGSADTPAAMGTAVLGHGEVALALCFLN
eukprot:scaffold200413_cov21-Tisochrysis_lutea.AAC.1